MIFYLDSFDLVVERSVVSFLKIEYMRCSLEEEVKI